MGRPIYSYELTDPDFSWLIASFRENHPDFSCVESVGLPVVFVYVDTDALGVVKTAAANEQIADQKATPPALQEKEKYESK